jgi:hypothetical protein
MQVDFHNNPQNIPDFVWQAFHQFFGIVQPHKVSIVVFANFQPTAIGVGKTAYPLEVFIPPRGLPFYVLIFTHFSSHVFWKLLEHAVKNTDKRWMEGGFFVSIGHSSLNCI